MVLVVSSAWGMVLSLPRPHIRVVRGSGNASGAWRVVRGKERDSLFPIRAAGRPPAPVVGSSLTAFHAHRWQSVRVARRPTAATRSHRSLGPRRTRLTNSLPQHII